MHDAIAVRRVALALAATQLHEFAAKAFAEHTIDNKVTSGVKYHQQVGNDQKANVGGVEAVVDAGIGRLDDIDH